MVELVGATPRRRFSTLVNPGVRIPFWITRLTGITDTMVRSAPRFEEIADQVAVWLGADMFVAHCAQFDYGFFQEEFGRLGRRFDRPYLCTRQLARHVLPGLTSYGLGALTQHVGVRIRHRHRALGDAAATARLLARLLDRAREAEVSVEELVRYPRVSTDGDGTRADGQS